MVKLFGGAISLNSAKRISYLVEGDKGYRSIYLTLLTTFKCVSYIIQIFCAFATFTTWLGQPITCFSDSEILGTEMLTSYCFTQIPQYQWIWIVIYLQGVMTNLPCLAWKYLEGNRLGRLLHKDSSIETISRFLYEHPNWYTLSDGVNFYCCQLLCLAISGFQIFLMDKFLGQAPVLSLLALTWPPPSLFQPMVSCNITYFGPTNEVQNVSGLCTLNYNFLYEKAFLLLFLIFFLLFVASLAQVLTQTLLALSPKFRVIWMIFTTSGLRTEDIKYSDLEKILGYPQLILYQLIQNNLINPNDIVKFLTKIVGHKRERVAVKNFTSRVSVNDSTQSARFRGHKLQGLPESAV